MCQLGDDKCKRKNALLIVLNKKKNLHQTSLLNNLIPDLETARGLYILIEYFY